MALEATHIKFALDIKDLLSVSDTQKYVAGAVYPDSRYVSKIERTITHDKRLLGPPIPENDFKKGWITHILCDRIGEDVRIATVPELFEELTERGQGTEYWVRATAIKVVQDMQVASTFDVQQYVSMLDYAENPNDEPIEKIKEYNNIVQKMYLGKNEVSVEDARELWDSFGVGDEFVERIVKKTNEFLADAKLVEKIHSLYGEMIRVTRQKIK